jgi:hypothetical protein
LIENGGVTHNFESGPSKDHFNSNFKAKDFDVIFISMQQLDFSIFEFQCWLISLKTLFVLWKDT